MSLYVTDGVKATLTHARHRGNVGKREKIPINRVARAEAQRRPGRASDKKRQRMRSNLEGRRASCVAATEFYKTQHAY
jgi:hypothetical protein